MTRLEALADAIKTYEGWWWGSKSWRHNNPGNLRWSKFQTGQKNGFAYFNSFATGWLALWYDLWKKCRGETVTGLTGDSTLLNLFEKWAPWSDGNNPERYADYIAKLLGVTTKTPLRFFIEDINSQ